MALYQNLLAYVACRDAVHITNADWLMSDSSSPHTPSSQVPSLGSMPDLQSAAEGGGHPVLAQRSLSTTVAVRRRQYIKQNEDARQARLGLERFNDGFANMKRTRSVSPLNTASDRVYGSQQISLLSALTWYSMACSLAEL